MVWRQLEVTKPIQGQLIFKQNTSNLTSVKGKEVDSKYYFIYIVLCMNNKHWK